MANYVYGTIIVHSTDNLERLEEIAKVGDIIVLAGSGIIDGVESLSSKHDTYKVSRIKSDGSISIKGYRGRTHLSISACAYNQKVLLLTKKEFNKLPILW